MINLVKLALFRPQRPSTLLGLALDGSRLQGVVVRRHNDSLEVLQSFSVTLALDPLTNAPELVGREIRNHLNAAGVRERSCVVAVPLKWALTSHFKLPALPEADLVSLLQIEVERGFPCDVSTLILGTSRFESASGEKHATVVGIPRNHLVLLETVLRSARLKPLSFGLGITALEAADSSTEGGALGLVIGETQVGLQITCAGGIAALRALEGVLEVNAGRPILRSEQVAREVRITLGQLPADVRQAVSRIRVFGPQDLARELVEELRPRVEAMEAKVELVSSYSAQEFGLPVPGGAAVTAALSMAARFLVGRAPVFEFLPPKITKWQQLTNRYSSGKLVWAGVSVGTVAFLVAAAFIVQQWQISSLQSKWKAMASEVGSLDDAQQQIRRFRPWFDHSLRSLAILRRLTEAFPQDGAVSAKSVEIRESANVTCSGTARDSQALLRTMEKLRAAKDVAEVKMDTIRGGNPLQFTFNFQWALGNSQ